MIAGLLLCLAIICVFPGVSPGNHLTPEFGKRYWLVDSATAHREVAFVYHFNFTRAIGEKDYLGRARESRSFIVKGKDQGVYRIVMDDGVEHSIVLETVDEAFRTHVIVAYDPVRRAKEKTAALEQERRRVITSRGWPPAIEKLVLDRKIKIGMTIEQALLSRGKPERINRTVTAQGSSEEWKYESSTLYFKNGALYSWQDSR